MTGEQTFTQAEILRLANRIRDELLAGDEAHAMRVLEPILTQPTLLSELDLLGQSIAETSAQATPGAFLSLLDRIASTRSSNAWYLIGSAIYAAFAHTRLPSAMQHARRHVARAANPEAADIIGERVPGWLLESYFEEGLSQLYDWVSDPSPWVRRALGIAVRFYVERHPDERGQIARLLQLVALLYRESDTDAIPGIGRALEAIGKSQPEMLTYWLYERREIGGAPHVLMLRHAAAHLPDGVRAAFLPDG